MKITLFAFIILSNTVLLQAQEQTRYSFDFSSDQGINTYSAKYNTCKIKDGRFMLSTSGQLSRGEFSAEPHADQFKRLEVSAVFMPGKLNETSRYGLVSGYKGYKKYVYGDASGGNYYHMLFEIDKLKKTFSVYDFTITGNGFFHDGVPNYYVKDKAAPEINAEGSDVLAMRRDNDAWDFSINKKLVYTRPDTSTQYNTSADIFLAGKTEVSVDDLKYNYAPDNNDQFIAPELFNIPASACMATDHRYINKKYGYTLCLGKEESADELTFKKFNHQYLMDVVTVSGYSDLPLYVYSLDFKDERDSLVVFKKFEQEFFTQLGEEKFISKEIYRDVYTAPSYEGEHASYFRGYSAMLKTGGEAQYCFEYMLGGNGKFDALAFTVMTPMGIEGLGYTMRNSALLAECVVLEPK